MNALLIPVVAKIETVRFTRAWRRTAKQPRMTRQTFNPRPLRYRRLTKQIMRQMRACDMQ